MEAHLYRCGKRALENIKYCVFDIPQEDRYCIIYFPKAKGTFTFNGKTEKFSPGNFIICSDKDDFSFCITSKKKTVFYFAELGLESENFLTSFNLKRGVFTSYREKETRGAFALLINEYIVKSLYQETKTDLFLINLICILSESLIKPPNGFEQILSLAKTINTSFSKSSIDIDPFADDAKLSKDRLSVIFKNHFSLPPHQYHNVLKMDEAEFLLCHSNFSVNEISKLLGFSNQLYFSSAYKKIKGENPTETRRRKKRVCSKM